MRVEWDITGFAVTADLDQGPIIEQDVARITHWDHVEHLCGDENSRIEVEGEIRRLLVSLDVPDRLIESRRYTEMLAERDRGVLRSPTA